MNPSALQLFELSQLLCFISFVLFLMSILIGWILEITMGNLSFQNSKTLDFWLRVSRIFFALFLLSGYVNFIVLTSNKNLGTFVIDTWENSHKEIK